MNQIHALAVAAFLVSGCASPRTPAPTNVHVQGAAPDPDNSQRWRPRAFKVGTRRFGTLEDLKAFIASLPPGSVVHWSSGCIRYELVSLAHSEMSIQDFKEYCKQHGVKFEYVVSGYKPRRHLAHDKLRSILQSAFESSNPLRSRRADCRF